MKQASLCSSIVHGGGKRRAALDHPLPTGRVVDEMSMVVTRQERHFEPSMRRVLGAHKKPKAESADRESPSRGVIAAPMANEPGEDEGDQPDATNPYKVMPHSSYLRFCAARSWPVHKPGFTKEISPDPAGLLGLSGRIVGTHSVQRALSRGHDRIIASHSC